MTSLASSLPSINDIILAQIEEINFRIAYRGTMLTPQYNAELSTFTFKTPSDVEML